MAETIDIGRADQHSSKPSPLMSPAELTEEPGFPMPPSPYMAKPWSSHDAEIGKENGKLVGPNDVAVSGVA